MTGTTQAAPASRTARRSPWLVVALCFSAIVSDGYDLAVYGVSLPRLLKEPGWDLSPAEAGTIGAYALMGMLVGALVVGTVTDLVGRRRILIGCVSWFSLCMVGAALAGTPGTFGLWRFVAGIGLGGVVPTAIAMTVEFARSDRRNLTNGLMFSGYSVGGVTAALVGITILADQGWRPLMGLGVVPLFVVVPLMVWLLPESPAFLDARGRHAEADAVRERFGLERPAVTVDVSDSAPAATARTSGFATIFSREYLPTTLLFWFATGMGLLLVYGLNTWLAQLMRKAGYDLGPALAFLLALNIGAVAGTFLAGRLSDRLGAKPVVVTMFATAAVCISLLSSKAGTPALLALVALAGAGTIGTTIILNSWTATRYPDHARATGLGWALGIGRLGAIAGPIYGGWLQDQGVGLAANFYAFAAVAVVGAVLASLIPARVGARVGLTGRSREVAAAGSGAAGTTAASRR